MRFSFALMPTTQFFVNDLEPETHTTSQSAPNSQTPIPQIRSTHHPQAALYSAAHS